LRDAIESHARRADITHNSLGRFEDPLAYWTHCGGS
jgi:hypothetical protein